MSIGGIQSNHTRQVTGVACHLGLKAVTVQEGWVDWPDLTGPDTAYDKVGNIQLTRIMGGDIRIDPAGFDIGIRDSWKRAIDSVLEVGGKPYPIPAGASDHPLGGMGFANWAREVAEQEAERDIFFDHVVVCTVTGSTHAGMIAGFALENRTDRHVIGIDASKTLEQTVDQVARIATNTAAMIGLDRDLRPDEITVVPGYEGPAYGVPDEQTIEAIHLAARTEGMLTDPVYEGKSMAGPDRHDPLRRDPCRLEGALRPPRRPARPPRLRRHPRPRQLNVWYESLRDGGQRAMWARTQRPESSSQPFVVA